jgi:hypothetical protein
MTSSCYVPSAVPDMVSGCAPTRRTPVPSSSCSAVSYFLRETLLLKTEGLTRAQLARPHPPSTLTLGGLLNHLALVEDWWFRVNALGLPHVAPWGDVDWSADPDFEFRTAADLEPEELRERYREACDRSREVVAQAESLVSRRRSRHAREVRGTSAGC